MISLSTATVIALQALQTSPQPIGTLFDRTVDRKAIHPGIATRLEEHGLAEIYLTDNGKWIRITEAGRNLRVADFALTGR